MPDLAVSEALGCHSLVDANPPVLPCCPCSVGQEETPDSPRHAPCGNPSAETATTSHRPDRRTVDPRPRIAHDPGAAHEACLVKLVLRRARLPPPTVGERRAVEAAAHHAQVKG